MQTRMFTLARVALLVMVVLGVSTTPAWCDIKYSIPDPTFVNPFGGNAGTYFLYSNATGSGYAFGQLGFTGNDLTDYTFVATDTFTLTITESSPSVGTETFYGVFSGNTLARNVELTLTSPSIDIGTEVFTFAPNPTGIDTSAQFKLTKLDGTVATVPEPSAAGLLTVALLGCCCVFRRRKVLESR